MELGTRDNSEWHLKVLNNYNRPMDKKLRVTLFLIISVLSTGVHAGQRWFHIEVIIFKQNADTNEVFEQAESQIDWPSRTASLSATQSSLSSLRRAPKSFASVQSSDRLLNNSYSTLRSKGGYRPLVHLSWVQAVGSHRISEAVRIHSGALNGLIRIQRGNYLHILADIEYNDGPNIYHLKEKRRFKLNETHYLDHPKLGIIVKVSPL